MPEQVVMDRALEDSVAQPLQELPGGSVIAPEDRFGWFNALGHPLGQILLHRLQRIFPVQRDGPAQGFGVFLLQGDLDEVFFALRQINILQADVMKFLGPRAAVEQHGDQEPLPGIAAMLVEPLDFRFLQEIRGLGR